MSADLTGEAITILTEDGTAPAQVFGPTGKPGVILYMDIFGPRPSLWGMAERIASWGYRVLVPDVFYRAGAYGPFDAATAFSDPDTKDQLMALAKGTTLGMSARDTGPYLDALVSNGATGPTGVVGYCNGGGRALVAAAAFPQRIAAAASFHGGNLATDAPDSPHLALVGYSGRVYVGAAGVDRSFPPEQAGKLAETLRESEVDHILEDYIGMNHGWCVPDHSVYDPEGAERHWARLKTLFAEKL